MRKNSSVDLFLKSGFSSLSGIVTVPLKVLHAAEKKTKTTLTTWLHGGAVCNHRIKVGFDIRKKNGTLLNFRFDKNHASFLRLRKTEITAVSLINSKINLNYVSNYRAVPMSTLCGTKDKTGRPCDKLITLCCLLPGNSKGAKQKQKTENRKRTTFQNSNRLFPIFYNFDYGLDAAVCGLLFLHIFRETFPKLIWYSPSTFDPIRSWLCTLTRAGALCPLTPSWLK